MPIYPPISTVRAIWPFTHTGAVKFPENMRIVLLYMAKYLNMFGLFLILADRNNIIHPQW